MELKEKAVFELKDTIDLMNSEDYKDRFKAEYLQTKIRYKKLHSMIVKFEAGTSDFVSNSGIDLLKHQKSMMGQYLYDLELRAEKEGIDLSQF